MNERVTRMALGCALTVVLSAGCAGSLAQTSYYTLYTPAPRTAAADGPLMVSVGPVSVPDILKQTQIATGGSDGRYRLSEYHRWSGEVDRDFARAVAEQLTSRLGTEQVAIFPEDQHFTPTCRVLINILGMGGEPGQEATLAVHWTLVDPRETSAPVIRRSDLREPTTTAGYPAWVAAQQRNIAKLGQEIAGAIQASVKP
jgi:uncharacterized lipoprotein YmbA